MSDQNFPALAGALAGAAITMDRVLDRSERRTRDAKDDARDAQRIARQALAKLGKMGVGDVERVGADRVADLMGGVALPATTAVPAPATFPTPPVPPQRPVFDEAVAASFSVYPGSTNAYNEEGKMIDPSSPFSGQNYATGVALSSVEARAALLGLMQQSPGNPTADHAKAIYRVFQGITRALVGNAQSQDEITAAINAMLGGQSGSYRKVAGFANASGLVFTGQSVEAEMFGLVVPANSLRSIGDELHIYDDGQQVTNNAADTTTERIRLGSVAGPILLDTGAQVFGAGDVRYARLLVTLVAPGQVRISGPFGRKGEASINLAAFDTTIDQRLVFTIQHSTNNAANKTRADHASIWLGR